MKRISELESQYVVEVLESQFRTSSNGIMTNRLEKKFADKFQSKYAIAFTNGTATLHAILAAAEIGEDDEVIVPPLTMASTALAVLHANATPVFADIDPGTWNINANSIQNCITERTKAIIPVAIYGLPPDMAAIMEIANQHNLFVLEDDAQCFLGYHDGNILGSIGHASSFSFQSSKHITSGEGGMVTTNDAELALAIRRFNSLGYGAVGGGIGKGKITSTDIQDPIYERHVSIGWNYRMPDLCAAVALGQVERLEEFVNTRTKVANFFREAMLGCDWLVPQFTPSECKHTYWSFVLKLDHSTINWYDFRDQYMKNGGDGIYAAWQLTYLEPAFRNKKFHSSQSQSFTPGLCPVAETIQPKLLQFKTNYFDLDIASQKAEALSKTIDHFGR